MDISKLKNLYISEAEDSLHDLNSFLLTLEKNPNNKDILNDLMRTAHNIKGSSATMGFESMAFLSHVLEDVFDYARNDLLKINSDIIDISFKATDALSSSLKSIKKTNNEDDLTSVASDLRGIAGVVTQGIGKSVRSAEGKPVVSKDPKQSKSDEVNKVIKSDKLPKDLAENERISSIKVPVERLDKLMDLTEDLVLDKMKLQIPLNKAFDDNKSMSHDEFYLKFPLAKDIKPIIDHLDRLTSDIQFQVMQARMVPLEQVFNRFPRMVRDLARKEDKTIDLQVTGGDMELDRTIVDKLSEPLIHLIRNAIDHGIEKTGIINLKAIRKREFILIIVENNGKNIDIEKIKIYLVKKGIITADRVDGLTDEQCFHLLFHPNFSTNDKVTEISGRGVGLSAVKRFADEVDGHVTIESAIEGGGCRFTLELPLTLAIVHTLLVRVGKNIFAIPFASIERSISISDNDIMDDNGKKIIHFDGDQIPVINLKESFNLPSEDKNIINKPVVIVKRGEEMAGIIVDELLDRHEIIVKPLPSVLKNIRGFSGSAVLGDGKNILILDIIDLLENVSKKKNLVSSLSF